MTKEKISAVYQIINTATGDRYVGSSRDAFHRWAGHKCPSVWKIYPNKQLYLDMQKFGIDKFIFQILAPVEPEYLKQVEQEFIEILKPTYNKNNAKGENVEKRKARCKVYNRLETTKEVRRKYRNSEKGQETRNKYINQLCAYNGETLTLNALYKRFQYAGIEHPTLEAKKYLLK